LPGIGSHTRTAWRRRARCAVRGGGLAGTPPGPGALERLTFQIDAGRRRRRGVPRLDGPGDVMRHAAPQSVRLAVVRRRSDADHRPLSARCTCRRDSSWDAAARRCASGPRSLRWVHDRQLRCRAVATIGARHRPPVLASTLPPPCTMQKSGSSTAGRSARD
jgi:hypothetical protein